MKQRNPRGQSLAELALFLPILIVLLGGLFDVGRAFLIQVAVENATGEGALYGASHPECLADDHALTICQGTESVLGRVQEEGKPFIELRPDNSYVLIRIKNNAPITAGSILEVEVTYRYTPLTPIGFMLWGDEAEVTTRAEQIILSPPPPGYQY